MATGHTPDHHCRLPAGASFNHSIPRDSNGKLSQCSMYLNSSFSNRTLSCLQGWTYDPNDSYTIVNKVSKTFAYSVFDSFISFVPHSNGFIHKFFIIIFNSSWLFVFWLPHISKALRCKPRFRWFTSHCVSFGSHHTVFSLIWIIQLSIGFHCFWTLPSCI